MIIASGFIEANSQDDVEKVSDELKTRDVEISDINKDKIVFLIEKNDISSVKESIESLKEIEGVRIVYLTYYSTESACEE